MTLADFTNPGLIIARLLGTDAACVIQELSQVLHREGRVPDFVSFYTAALDRESVASTNLGSEMAIPHVRLKTLKALSFSFGRSHQMIPWETRETHGVRMVFLFAVPEDHVAEYF